MIEKELTDKQKIFCLEYVIDFNATRAAVSSGYSVRSAKSIGGENLSKPIIQKEIKRLCKEVRMKLQIKKETVINEIRKIAMPSRDEFFDLLELDYKMKDKIKALEFLCKHLGLFEKDDNPHGRISSENR